METQPRETILTTHQVGNLAKELFSKRRRRRDIAEESLPQGIAEKGVWETRCLREITEEPTPKTVVEDSIKKYRLNQSLT